MIAPFVSEILDGVYWASMRGSFDYHTRLSALFDGTDHARLVEDLADQNLTAIFEFCSQENRIVVSYPEPNMTLLAVRHLHTGHYHDLAALEKLAHDYGIGAVRPLAHAAGSASELMSEMKDVEALEGAVLWQNGRPLAKFKGQWYLRLHKLLGNFEFEKDVARLVLAGNTDDLMGILNAEKRAALTQYQDALLAGLKTVTDQCGIIRDDVIARGIDRKNFAVSYDAPQILKAVMFKHFDQLEQAEFYEDIVSKAQSMTGSFGKWDNFKSSIDLKIDWDVDHLG